MSENGESVHHDHSQISLANSGHTPLPNTMTSMIPEPQAVTNPHGFEPSSYMSFTNCLQDPIEYDLLERAVLDMCSLPDIFQSGDGVGAANELMEPSVRGGNSMTLNSSSSSLAEAAAEEDVGMCKKDEQNKGTQDGTETTEKVNKPRRKKREKSEREPRFVFLTKSEADHLEDGYRWRKYGQKAVKNSAYPRSYYRCTNKNCSVKKRVERSFQDPTAVITTYEGKHTHPCPGTLQGIINPSSALTSASPMPSFHHELLMNMPPTNYNTQGEASSVHMRNLTNSHQQSQVFDYGLLQDIVPSFIPKEP